jgi:Tol biopolymer transport system component
VYAIGVPKPRLSVYDERSRTFTPFLGGIPAFAVRFSPDRQWVAYIDIRDYTVWRARADGSDPRQLTTSAWSVDALAWNPDSLRLAIRAQAPGQKYKKIHVLSADGGTPVPLDPRDIEQGSPTWSPDGNRIAFGDVPETHGDATGSERIQIFDLATRQMRELAGSQGLWSSRWSPDGRYLAATRIADRALMLYTFAASRWRELKLTRVDDLVWTTDSRYLYCNPEGPRWASRVRVSDGHVEPFLNVSGESIHTSASLALDGRPLFLRDTADVFALELARR